MAEEIHKQSRRCVLKDVKNIEGSTHPGLWLDRYATYTAPERADQKAPEAWKAGFIQEICQLSNTANTDPYRAFFNRWKKALDDAGAHTRTGTVRTRMVLGLGSEGVLETSIALHRTYGVPYIPGSALKGLLAAYMRKHYASAKEYAALATFLFGTTKGAGYLTLYDALYVPGTGFKIDRKPVPLVEWRGGGLARRQGTGFKIDRKPVPLHADVMTVHHAEYYGNKKKPPADSDSPVPVPFLTATGKYCLAMGMPGVDAGEQEQARHWIDFAFEVLAKALDEWGVGAKTSSGYGRLDVLPDGSARAGLAAEPSAAAVAVEVAEWQNRSVQMQLDELRDDGCIVKPMGGTKFPLRGFVPQEQFAGRTPQQGNTMNCIVRELVERDGEKLALMDWNQPKKKKGK